MPDQAVLMVPVHLDVLVLGQDRAVVDTLADFTPMDGPAVTQLPDPLTGLETPVRSTLDIYQRRLVPPDSAGTSSPRELREGCLTLTRLGATT